MDAALARIAAKLAELQAQGWEKHAHQFNVPGHRFALGPVTSADAIAAFEAKHSVELPAEFRAFITTIAGSGAAPYHGLLPIERWDDFWDGELIAVCEQGCGYWTALSVTGRDRGRLFNLYGEQRTLVRDRSFLVWYERWLDEMLAGIATSSFGWHRGGSEDELAAELAAATEVADQIDIISSLSGRPTLAPATLDLVAPLITSARHAVRTACCRVLSRDPRFTAAIVALLGDPDYGVRTSAVYALSRMDARSEAPAIAELIVRDPTMMYAAARTLRDWGLLRGSMLAPLVTSPDVGVRSSIPGFLEKLDDDLAPFEPLLEDPDLHVRIYAFHAFVARGVLGPLRARITAEPHESLRAAIAKRLGD